MIENNKKTEETPVSASNVIILEDTFHVANSAKSTLTILGYSDKQIFSAKTFGSASYFLEEKPGWKSFKYLIVDLNIPCKYEDYFNKDELRELDRVSQNVHSKDIKLSGWIWLKRLVRKHEELRNRIIVLSAYVNELPEDEKNQYREFLFLDKTEADTVQKLKFALRNNNKS